MKTILQNVQITDPDTGRVSVGKVERQVLEPTDVDDILGAVDLDGVVVGAIENKEQDWSVLYQGAVQAVTQVVKNQASIIQNQQAMMAAQQTIIEELATRLDQLTETVESLLPEEPEV